VTVYRDQKCWLDGLNLTGKLNSMAIQCKINANDTTVFGNTTRTNGAGLFENTASVAGFYDPTYDASLNTYLGVADKPFSFSSTGTAGAVAYSFKALQGSYTPMQGSVGDEHGFSAEAMGSGRLIRGTLAINGSALTSSGNGSGYQLGTISSTQKLYAVLHVTAASGTSPTLDAIIQSDNNSGFTTPLTRVTFTQKTAIGSQWSEVSGAITDDYWRVNYTIAGTNPVFDFIVILAIL